MRYTRLVQLPPSQDAWQGPETPSLRTAKGLHEATVDQSRSQLQWSLAMMALTLGTEAHALSVVMWWLLLEGLRAQARLLPMIAEIRQGFPSYPARQVRSEMHV